MKWLILALCAEVSVLACLIFAFDGAMQQAATRRLTWDHAAVLVIYAMVRTAYSWRRIARPFSAAQSPSLRRAALLRRV